MLPARLMEDLKPNYKKIGNWLPLLVLNESVNRSLVTQNGVEFHPILHLVLGVIFLCQKIRKALFSLCFFLEKGFLATTTPPAPPPTIRELAPGLLLWSLRARGNLDKQFGSLLNKISETQETQNKGLRPTSGVPLLLPACTRAREGSEASQRLSVGSNG